MNTVERDIPPVYVINLTRSPERWARLSEALTRRGIRCERIEAVDGREMTKEEIERHTEAGNWYRLAPTTLALRLSFYRAWSAIAQGDAPGGVVLEDDAVLLPGFKKALQSLTQDAVKHPSAKPLLVKLYNHGAGRLGWFPGADAIERRLDHGRALGTGLHRLREPLLPTYVDVANWLNQAAAQRLVEHFGSLRFAHTNDEDLAYRWRTGVEMRLLEPQVVEHGEKRTKKLIEWSTLEVERSSTQRTATATWRGKLRKTTEMARFTVRNLVYTATGI